MDESQTMAKLTRSSSTVSVESTASFDSDDLNEETVYEKAPWDLFGDHPGLGRIKLAKAGALLPIETGYKTKKDGTGEIGVKFRYYNEIKYIKWRYFCFRVTQNLEIQVVKIKQ